jgi:hypothetical protein
MVLLLHYVLDNSMHPAFHLLPSFRSLHGHNNSALESLQTAPPIPTTTVWIIALVVLNTTLNTLGLQSGSDLPMYVCLSTSLHRLFRITCIPYY